MIFYTADLHFHYEPAAEERGFSSAAEMDEFLIAKWNETVSEGDTVYVVGDVGYNDNHVPADALRRLKGVKHLIRGNHDTGFEDAPLLYDYFETITDFNEIEDGDNHIILCHYPLVHNKKPFMIHGHLHKLNPFYYSILKELPRVLNCSSSLNGFSPVQLSVLIENNNRFFGRDHTDLASFDKRGRKTGPGYLPVKPDFKPVPERPNPENI